MNQEKDEPERKYRTSEAARYLGISRYAVMGQCKAGALGFYWIGSRRVFSESHLKTFLAEREVKPKRQAA